MPKYNCPKCDSAFSAPSLLQRHLNRKKPCDSKKDEQPEEHIVDATPTGHLCSTCNKDFPTPQGVERHEPICPAKKSIKEAVDTLVAQMGLLLARIDKLEKNTAPWEPVDRDAVAGLANGQSSASTSTTKECLRWEDTSDAITYGILKQAYLENEKLRVHMGFPEEKQNNIEVTPPFVTELITEIIRQLYKNEANRNLLMDPANAGQVHVYQGGEWTPKPLTEIVDDLCELITKRANRLVIHANAEKNISKEVVESVVWIVMTFISDKTTYSAKIKAFLATRLAKFRPVSK